MKKLFLACAIIAMTLAFNVSLSYAATNKVTEKPNIKINIDGEIGQYKDVPIVVNGRTMLPLVELLVNLGVQKDSEHIIWNSKERSITINKDTQKIVLKVDNKSATVNDKAVSLDVAPVIYKSKTYIPAGFVAQALGKKVVWDGTSSMVLIRDIEEFNNIKELLGKINTAMNSNERSKDLYVQTLDFNSEGSVGTTELKVQSEADFKNKKIYSKMDSSISYEETGETESSVTELVMSNNAVYVKQKSETEWKKYDESEEAFNKLFVYDDITPDSDVLCAGLYYTEENNVLTVAGLVNAGEYLKEAVENQGLDKYSLTDVALVIYVEKDTYRIKEIVATGTGTATLSDNSILEFIIVAKNTFSEYDGNFEVQLPQDLE
ncbi:MAG: copper amine oxidase N-terminal domain-containing protein [Clostridia bacterium]|nr:copper amine oxidase N-terminal domain-containing protein [Clostridia bacterium]